MDLMDEFHQKIQTFLVKKDPEVGKLKFLSSRSTEKNIEHIEQIATSICSIFEACNIPIKKETSTSNMKCIEALKYLVLNTNFKTQEFLQDDLLHGHLVDMCPPLSPYLLIELIWSLEYEKVLAESILHYPLDLCIEILEILRRCVLVFDFQRGFNLLLTLTNNCYMKLIIIRDLGTQSMDFDANLESLIINYQEIMSLLRDKRCTRLAEIFELKRSERYGYILREILILTKNCLELNQRGVVIDAQREKLYKITLGRETVHKCDAEAAMRHLKSLDLELTDLLLKNVKEINCNIYLDWASLEGDGNPSASLQQMIGIECFNLIQCIKINSVEGQEHLLTCLQQLSVNPETLTLCTKMNLNELCKGVEEGNHDCLTELLSLHQNWDHSVFELIRKRANLFDGDDCVHLLEYLTELMPQEGHKKYKQMVYSTVTRVLLHQNLKNLYEVTLKYILKHNAENILESAHTEQMFEEFILKNPDFETPTKLKIVLFFLLKNPQKFLTILIKICIGTEKYDSIMINPDDLTLLAPVMNIRNGTEKLVLSCLLRIGLERYEFIPMKFSNFIKSMLEHSIFTSNELINSVYIPFIRTIDLPVSTLRSTLDSIRQIVATSNEVNHGLLLKSLATRFSQLRNDKNISKYLNSDLLTLIIRIVRTVLRTRDNWFEDGERRRWIIELEAFLQPIDKFYFSELFSSAEYINVTDIFEDYLRQTNTILQKLTPESQEIPLHKLINLEKEVMKHIILTCTESENVRIASEITVIHWNYFKNSNEVEGFDKIVSITIEACDYCLKAQDTKPEHFGCLIKSLAKFMKGLIYLELGIDKQIFLDLFVDNFMKLNESVKGTEYEHYYNEVLVQMNNLPRYESAVESLAEVVNFVSCFGDKCLTKLTVDRYEAEGEFSRTQIYQELITMCLVASFDNQFCIIRRVKNLFLFSQ